MESSSYSGHISKLENDEVFVFGSNLQGFHGAGSAGFATFNVSGNVWRDHKYDLWGNGSKGKWNIKGVGWGFQEGEIGKSYAIPTVTHAGKKRSMPLSKIIAQIINFYNFAKGTPQWKFYIAQENRVGLNGYSPQEMADAWFEYAVVPKNVIFNSSFLKLL